MRRAVNSALSQALAWPVTYYITQHRDRLAPMARPIGENAVAQIAEYFPATDLARLRVVAPEDWQVQEPPLRSVVRSLGFSFPDTSTVAAITFDYVVATRRPMGADLLFHEMVHVVQYRLLGIGRFAQLYVRGFLESGCYERIPLERCAFELEQRFVVEPASFSVEAEVAAWIERDLF